MGWVSLVVALYGAGLSSTLAYLAWRKDRYSVRFFVSYGHRHDWYGMTISAVNVGFRPITFHEMTFKQGEFEGYMFRPEEEVAFPRKLAEGEQLVISFHAEDIEPDTTEFVLYDTHRRPHRLDLTAEMQHLDAIRELVREARPQLYAAGQNLIAAIMRRPAP